MVYLVRKTAYFKIASSHFIIYCFILFGNFTELRLNIRRLQHMYITYCSYLLTFLHGYERGTGYPVALMVSVLSKVADFKADFNSSDY